MKDEYIIDYVATPEPDVSVPMPSRGGSPYCPACGYSCGCCCYDECQTPCPAPDEDGYCDCVKKSCHGGHEPWDCQNFSTRYRWALAKSERLAASAIIDE